MSETQQTVSGWAEATFPGADPASPRGALRCLEEAVELCLAAGASRADVTAAVSRAVGAEPGDRGAAGVRRLDKVPAEAADVLITLYALAGRGGFDLRAEVDKKMAVNRARRWRALGDGTGYHVKADPAPGG